MSPQYVLLHGSPGNGRSWLPLLAAAPAGVRCHAWDLLDHTAAADAPGADVDDIVHDVARRIRALEGPITIVGHSFGAWVGGRALAALGGKVEHFVAIAGLASIAPDIAERSTGFAAALEAEQLTIPIAAGMGCDIWLPKEGREPAHERAILEDLESAGVERLCRVLRRHASLADPARRVPSSRVRATLLHATDDRGCPIASGRDLASCFSNAEFIELPGDSHFLHWTHTAAVAHVVFG